MANNDMIIIDSIVQDRLLEKGLSDTDKTRGAEFEEFAFQEILKSYDISNSQLVDGIVDGQDDGGIDGFYIFVNGIPVIDPDDFPWPRRNAELDIYIITSKHHDTYELGPLESLDSTLSEVFNLRLSTDKFSSKLNSRVISKRNTLVHTYRKIGHILENCIISIIYVSRGDSSQVAPNIAAKGQKIEKTCVENFTDCETKLSFLGSKELVSLYRKKRNSPVSIKITECFQRKSDYVALVTLSDYYSFVTDDKGKLKRYYFEENVRDYLGTNRTNVDIQNTLLNPDSPDFWLLNNGVTILASKAILYDKQLEVENVQIVNGLQTTTAIYQHFSNRKEENDNRSLLVKIICSSNEDVRHEIIQATNNQSAIPLYSLHATDKIQKDIEDIMIQSGLFYERKINYYKNLGYDEEKIFAPLYLAGGYVTLIMKLPYAAAVLKSKFMNEPSQYVKVFSPKSDLRVWPVIAKILRKVDSVAEANRAKIKTSSEKYLKTVRPIISLLCVARLQGKFNFGENDLIRMDIELLDDALIADVVNDLVNLINSDGSLKSIKNVANYGKIGEIIKKLGEKYKLPDYITIEKRKSFIVNNYEITEDFLNEVREYLPAQPWPAGIHKVIAETIGSTNSKVYRAIDELIERGIFRAQIDGKVTD